LGYFIWKGLAPLLNIALPSVVQASPRLYLYKSATLTTLPRLDLADTGYLDCLLLCNCCYHSTSFNLSGRLG
jgi:hypothetical protein